MVNFEIWPFISKSHGVLPNMQFPHQNKNIKTIDQNIKTIDPIKKSFLYNGFNHCVSCGYCKKMDILHGFCKYSSVILLDGTWYAEI